MIRRWTPLIIFLLSLAVLTVNLSLGLNPFDEGLVDVGAQRVLAGDVLSSAADLDLPLVGVTLVSRQGYFRQSFAADGAQRAAPRTGPGRADYSRPGSSS